MNRITIIAGATALVIIATLAVWLVSTRADLSAAESDKRVLASDNALQREAIATQVFNINRFNQTAANAAHASALTSASSDEAVIEYREILRHEKTCDFAVPVSVARGLLGYANRLRASALGATPSGSDTAGDRTAATGTLTYCQVALWIQPLLAAVETANNQLAGIREIEQQRAQQSTQTGLTGARP
ncbi:hypothetical protein A3780_05040 [Kosakonia radicincitans]|uniref:hypothetical protein n=1 Tax=Kosakonia radicincitans TaxID=283686 RepID=UPI0009041102|nr:hypothetical protein [Kosakonia radicincitans]APG16959.1 hypothetical protein A3780_05040 [Kosakonia radicincitans]